MTEITKEREQKDLSVLGVTNNIMEEINNSNMKQEESKASGIINEEQSKEEHPDRVFQFEEAKDTNQSNRIAKNDDNSKSKGKDTNENGKVLLLLTETIDGNEPMENNLSEETVVRRLITRSK